jgi:hypothetical protein
MGDQRSFLERKRILPGFGLEKVDSEVFHLLSDFLIERKTILSRNHRDTNLFMPSFPVWGWRVDEPFIRAIEGSELMTKDIEVVHQGVHSLFARSYGHLLPRFPRQALFNEALGLGVGSYFVLVWSKTRTRNPAMKRLFEGFVENGKKFGVDVKALIGNDPDPHRIFQKIVHDAYAVLLETLMHLRRIHADGVSASGSWSRLADVIRRHPHYCFSSGFSIAVPAAYLHAHAGLRDHPDDEKTVQSHLSILASSRSVPDYLQAISIGKISRKSGVRRQKRSVIPSSKDGSTIPFLMDHLDADPESLNQEVRFLADHVLSIGTKIDLEKTFVSDISFNEFEYTIDWFLRDRSLVFNPKGKVDLGQLVKMASGHLLSHHLGSHRKGMVKTTVFVELFSELAVQHLQTDSLSGKRFSEFKKRMKEEMKIRLRIIGFSAVSGNEKYRDINPVIELAFRMKRMDCLQKLTGFETLFTIATAGRKSSPMDQSVHAKLMRQLNGSTNMMDFLRKIVS